jgi:5-methylcytosine-specific restriction endonuclease McrA
MGSTDGEATQGLRQAVTDKDRKAAYWKDYYQKNAARIRAMRREYARQHRAEHRAAVVRLTQRDPTYFKRWHLANRDERNAKTREWARANPERVLMRTRGRRAAKRGLTKHFTLAEWREKLDLFAHCCAYCGESESLTVDHRIPLSRGGSDEISNIVPACSRCNCSKGTKTDREFIKCA